MTISSRTYGNIENVFPVLEEDGTPSSLINRMNFNGSEVKVPTLICKTSKDIDAAITTVFKSIITNGDRKLTLGAFLIPNTEGLEYYLEKLEKVGILLPKASIAFNLFSRNGIGYDIEIIATSMADGTAYDMLSKTMLPALLKDTGFSSTPITTDDSRHPCYSGSGEEDPC